MIKINDNGFFSANKMTCYYFNWFDTIFFNIYNLILLLLTINICFYDFLMEDCGQIDGIIIFCRKVDSLVWDSHSSYLNLTCFFSRATCGKIG